MTIDVAAALEMAAWHLEQNGWSGARIGNPTGYQPVCAGVAICKTLRSYDHSDAHQALAEYLGGHGQTDIFRWNDAPGQTKENVIATMRACAAIWRAKHEERQGAEKGLQSEVVTLNSPGMGHCVSEIAPEFV